MKRRLFSVLMVLALLCSMMTTAAYASVSIAFDEVDAGMDALTAQARVMFVQYHSLQDTRQELYRSREVLKKNYAAVQKQVEMHLATELDQKNMQRNLESLNTSIETLTVNIEQVRRSFSSLVGGNFKGKEIKDDGTASGNIILKSLPSVEKYISELKINLGNDLDDYLGLDEDYSDPGTELKKTSFETLYKDVKSKETALQKERDYYELEQQNFGVAQKKKEMGLISELEMVNAQDKLDTQAGKVKTAENDLFLSAVKYDNARTYGTLDTASGMG